MKKGRREIYNTVQDLPTRVAHMSNLLHKIGEGKERNERRKEGWGKKEEGSLVPRKQTLSLPLFDKTMKVYLKLC